MTNPIGRFHNAETGEVIDRPLTDAEYADLTNADTGKPTSQVKHLTENHTEDE